jgi:membrane carboxypeptidase/penicillin-binding protein PbpC
MKWPTVRRALLYVTGVIGVCGIATALFIAWPLPEDMRTPGPVPGLRIEDRHGLVLRSTRAPDGSRGGWVSLADVDPQVIQAFIATEDRRFFQHHGVDAPGVVRAGRDNHAAGGNVSRASTRTMEAGRLVRPGPRTWDGTKGEARWARRKDAPRPKERNQQI